MIIKLYGNENYEYPFIEINNSYFKTFKRALKTYQKDINYDFNTFIQMIEKKKWFIKIIYYDEKVFF